MFKSAICPHCESTLTSVDIKGLDGKVEGVTKWKCIAYCCPKCSKVLSTSVDPIALKVDTLDAVERLLRRV